MNRNKGTRALTFALIGSVILAAAAAAHGATPEEKCRASKNKAAGKYAACMQGAEQKFVLNADAAKLAAAELKCQEKLVKAWTKADENAVEASTSCPDAPLLVAAYQNVINAHTTNIATALAGGGLQDFVADLADCDADLLSTQGQLTTCSGNLSTTQGQLTTTQGQLATCSGNLGTCNSDLGTCNSDLGTCNSDLGTCSSDLGTCNSDLGICESDLSDAVDELDLCSTENAGLQSDLDDCSAENDTLSDDLATCEGDLAACQSAAGCGFLGIHGDYSVTFAGGVNDTCDLALELNGSGASLSISSCNSLAPATFTATVNPNTGAVSVTQPSSPTCAGFFTLQVNATFASDCESFTGTYACVGFNSGTLTGTRN